MYKILTQKTERLREIVYNYYISGSGIFSRIGRWSKIEKFYLLPFAVASTKMRVRGNTPRECNSRCV